MPVIMGTAGHIDHGKTTLIKALTGIDCDRLDEEKRRGITIELGFAFLDLPDGARLGIVDVPGHERFVKNMVAGASGIDFALLVIAADEGVMPQTREHVDICALLGIETGVVALTKTDMVDEEWMGLVTEDVKGFLTNTFLAEAPVVPVSAHTGQGLDELKQELGRLARDFAPKRRSDLFRLPIDRVFTMRGHGTVVTGTLVSGKVHVGEEILLYPRGVPTKVRGLQSHGQTVETAPAGLRTAVNLHGLEVDDLQRGEVLARPGSLFPGQVWDVEITYLSSAGRELKHRKEVHFHHETREVLAKIYLLDRDVLLPGDKAPCQFRFSEPMAGVYGDRVVIRSFSPLRTIAGGKLINPLGRKVKRFSEQGLEDLGVLARGEVGEIVARQLRMAGPEGLGFARLMTLTNQESGDLEKLLGLMGSREELFLYDRETRTFVSGEILAELLAGVLEFLRRFHEKEPIKAGVSRGELASAWGAKLRPKLFHFLIERMLKKGDIRAEAELLCLPDHEVSMALDQTKLMRGLLEVYEKGGLAPPNRKAVLDSLGATLKQAAPVYGLLKERGELVKVKEDMYFSKGAVSDLTQKVVSHLKEHGEMGAQDFKGLTGLSRKFAIPLLEYLDKEKITVRVGDNRVLRKR